MIRTTEYGGYTICQQKEFGPLKLLQWVENGAFILVKENTNVMPSVTFRTVDDAQKFINTLNGHIEAFRTLARHKNRS